MIAKRMHALLKKTTMIFETLMPGLSSVQFNLPKYKPTRPNPQAGSA
jgi:hypothetical protein